MSRPASVLGQLRVTVERERLFEPGQRVLVAVSGGADSVALFHLLQAVGTGWRLRLQGFHLDHRLRPESSADAEFVRRLFQGCGCPLTVVRSDVAGYSRRHKVGIEAAGRELRYRYLDRIRRRTGCDRVALGHTADDNLETMLLNLARGAGPGGLAGIPVRRGRVVRPLLDLEHRGLVAWLRARGHDWVEDRTNADPAFRRNLLRSTALEALRQVNPRCAAHARTAAGLLRAEHDYLDALAAAALDGCAVRRCGRVSIDSRNLTSYNSVLRRRMIRLLIPELDADGVQRLLDFVAAGRGRLALPGATARRQGDRVEIRTGSGSD